ncbi:MAG: DMT family transporter [Litoreibacter sp.]|uniref:DMT family transporter n=1 Tax=Litoreibacter sp. TaxID=1969459 RepID=UPI00329A4498
MSALSLGLIAAVCWGLHDILVRQVSQRAPLMASLLMVLLAGSILQGVLMVATDAVEPVSLEAAIYAAISGVFFLVASIGLYLAFQRGPVRLVSPIIASYPILSVAWAAISGTSISALEWLAVLLIVIGVSIVAALSGQDEDDIPPMGRTVAYSLIASVGFAGTFAIGQIATEMSSELPVILITRLMSITLLVVGMMVMKLPFNPGRASIPVLLAMGCLDGISLMVVLFAGGLPDAQYASVAASMFGLITIVMAWTFLRERMSPIQWLGCLVAFAGIGYLAL